MTAGHKNKKNFSAAALPRWNLADLYASPDCTQMRQDRAWIEDAIFDFENSYKDQVATLDAAALGRAIAAYEKIETRRARIDSYLSLLEADNTANYVRTRALRDWSAEQEEKISFFRDELTAMRRVDLMSRLSDPVCSRYAAWLGALQETGGADVDENILQLSNAFARANTAAWERLYHETMDGLLVTAGGETISFKTAEERATDPALSRAAQEELRVAMTAALKSVAPRMALIYNAQARDRLTEAETFGFARVDEETHRNNGLTSDAVDTMCQTLKSAYSRLSHRYFAWKAEQQESAALNPALQKVSPAPPSHYPFASARGVILRALRRFSPRIERLARRVFDDKHIDAAPRAGKTGGWFCWSVGPGVLPYVAVHYTGTLSDVVGLGHEIGHAVHGALAARAQGLLLSTMPVPLEETASIFAETLVHEELLRDEKDPARRRAMLADRIENMLDSSLKQIAYFDFERRVHAEIAKRELSAEDIGDIWLQTVREYRGPTFGCDEYDRYSWMTVHHFFELPFYVYSYAFAQQVVSGLYNVYQAAEREGRDARDAFVEKYVALLESGGSKGIADALRPFGLDPEKPEFWRDSLKQTEKYLDALEREAPPAAARAQPPKNGR